MKKITKLIVACAALFVVASCSDVPNPYELVTSDPSAGKTLPYKNNSLSSGFTVQTIAGNAWSQGSTYTQASGYSGGTYSASESWLVSPGIQIGEDSAVLSFDYTIRYGSSIKDEELGDYHQVLISTDYVDDVTTATWASLPFTPVKSPYSDWTLYSSGDIQIPQEFMNQQKVYIAFIYKCGASQGTTTTWELENFSIKEGVAQSQGDNPEVTVKDPIGKGNGTMDAPYNAFQADSISALLASGETTAEVYVKGYISQINEVETDRYGNAIYFISDDGTTANQYEIYHGYYLNGDKFTSKEQIQIGDTVIVCGKLTKYNNTKEMAAYSKIVWLNGQTSGNDNPQPSTTFSYGMVNTISDGEFIIATPTSETNYVLATSLGSKSYGYLSGSNAAVANGIIETTSKDVAWTFKAVNGGYTIQDSDGRYLYMTGNYNSFNISTEQTDGYIWSVSFNADGTVNILNNTMQKTIQYSPNYSSYGAYSDVTNALPRLFKKDAEGVDPSNTDITGTGTKEDPYNIAKVQSVGATNVHAWVKGYIVGYVNGAAIATGATFGVPNSAETEILIADSPDENDYKKCVPVQLPAGDIRTNLELSAHSDLYKKEIILYGQLTTYFGVIGVKSTSCALYGNNVYGTMPADN